ncbi:MAG: acyl-CoA/acyl-ACP dehydrogenase [Desulfobacteraceae bacterium]|nr:acyl-CoA/acyl-ACP dehydrogenase [Desulfobacteraceae bacterium]
MEHFPPMYSDEDKMLAQMIRRFVDQEIMPIRDKIDDDHDHVLINGILKKMSALGVFGARVRDANTPPPSPFAGHIVAEEMSRGDPGIGLVLGISGWAMYAAIQAKNMEVLELYNSMAKKREPNLACFAMTEPASGCDVENLPELHGRTIKTRAVKEGDNWVINGAKRFPSNAGISSVYCVVCQTDPEKGEEGIAQIYVPYDAEGLSFGKFENKAGMQADRNCDIFFDDVRVPLSYRAHGPGKDAEYLKDNVTNGRLGSGSAAIGCARGAYEEVLRYTGERVVAGKPIREHSIAAGILADMATGIESARAFCLQVSLMRTQPEVYGSTHSDTMLSYTSMAKNYACEVAVSVTNKAMELMGSYGYIRDYHVEKYWRDVKEIQLWLGGVQLAQFDVMRGYYPYKVT